MASISENKIMTTGSCLCGAVRYEVKGPYAWMAHCHCSMCRKHHGALYGTMLGAAKANFRWLSGEAAIVHYRASSAFERPFCEHCGSTVPDTSGEHVIVPAGTLTEAIEMKPSAHIFVASKSPMCEITDSLRQFDEYPPGFGTAVSAPVAPSTDGSLTGSCLCGEIAYAIDQTPSKLVHCHCTRCQRSRGTAHASNTFVRQEHLRWLRGAESLKTYKVAQAQAFTTTFCARCGSLLPSLFEPIKRYNVPLGSLDQPLAAKPSLHIHVASRAAWFDITDALERFDEMPARERIKELMF
jgi:hypothetical protein